jgi:F-type H+-transporting ATPase subunit gamma
MSQLVALARRIKTVQTIQKTTSAIRLIAMSEHERFKKQRLQFGVYDQAVSQLFQRIKEAHPQWTHPILAPEIVHATTDLVILIGSQKGLCGGFNKGLFRFFEQKRKNTHNEIEIAVIGKQACSLVAKAKFKSVVFVRQQLALELIGTIAQELCDFILYQRALYRQVSIVSNLPKNFFVQEPQEHILLPLLVQTHPLNGIQYYREQDIGTIATILGREYVISSLYRTMLASCIAEQAARFVSMDTATKNAENLLEASCVAYNKLRQARITKELNELSGSFLRSNH